MQAGARHENAARVFWRRFGVAQGKSGGNLFYRMVDEFFEVAVHFWPSSVGFAHKLFAFHIATSSARLLRYRHTETGRERFHFALEWRDCAIRIRRAMPVEFLDVCRIKIDGKNVCAIRQGKTFKFNAGQN